MESNKGTLAPVPPRMSKEVVFETPRDGIEAGQDKAKTEPSMVRMEVDNTKVSLPSQVVEPKTLVNEDLDRMKQVILEEDWDFLCTENEEKEWAAWQEKFTEAAETTAVVTEPKRTESLEEREARREEQRKADLEKFGSDYEALLASQFREDWDFVWSRRHGLFEDTSEFSISLLHS
ncbi:hypothetical protein PR202_gn00493 [Eleusine coracana subsp. coracana]|uniref:Uncharacterized protein n=1 Tax=Eleusine coracana subsp. coracana TaxID=191504 RepID=A0AAV5G3T0_ELECO|nr:hypothetical protein PR202_gn00493 [Eleusine coracana subsp. coracana]